MSASEANWLRKGPMGDESPNGAEGEKGRVMLLPPTSRDGVALCKLLSASSVPHVLHQTLNALCEDLDARAGAVLVSEESLAEAEPLTSALTRQPVWSDLPVIVLSRGGPESPRLTAILPQLGNVTVLERPVRMSTLLTVVRSSLRARRRQYEVRDHLAELGRIAQALRGSEERLRLAAKTGRLGVWELDLSSNLLTCSATCKANFGRAPDEPFTYADLWSSVHPDDAPRVQEAVRRAIAERVDYDPEYRAVWPDGTVHWILVRGRADYAADGAPLRMVGVTLDITERRLAEDQRQALLEAERAARSEAERASRMKDEFLATVSHELRTPLNAILGWSQILGSGPAAPEDVEEGLQVIERNARAQTQIIEDLLDMSRIISGKIRLNLRRIDLADVVRSAVETVQPAADARGVELRVELEPGVCSINGDPDRLQQVFWNLLNNAVKFTPRGGRVRAMLRRTESHCEVSVVDTGEGIDLDFLPYVFDRFRQADASISRKHSGLGLGLAIVRQLVELHGGSVSAGSSGRGAGAAFVVQLPTAVSHPGPTPTPALESYPTAATRKTVDSIPCARIHGVRVLVVDDEHDARNLLRRMLEDCEAVVTMASSAEEALRSLQAERPDVIISDIGMPGEDGYDLIRKVRALDAESGGQTAAIALTAYARAEDRTRAIRAGFQLHVAKPIDQSVLIATVASLLPQATATPH